MSKYLFIFLFSLSFIQNDSISSISTRNDLKLQAETAFRSKKYKEAIHTYKLLKDSFALKDPRLFLNLAHAYYKLNHLDSAYVVYEEIIASNNNILASTAYAQLAKIKLDKEPIVLNTAAYKTMKPEQISTVMQAAELYKKALKADYTNENARYNYEAIKKWLNNLPEDKKQEQQKHEQQQKKEQEQKRKEEEKQKKEEQQKEQQDKEQNNENKSEKKDEDQKGENKKDEGQKGTPEKQEGNKDKKEGEKGEEKNDKKDEGKQGKNKEKDEESKENKPEEGKSDKGEKDDKNQTQEGQEQSAEERKAQEKAQREQQIQQRLEENNFTKDKALQLLRSIDQQEKKYLQQMERKSQNKNNSDGKPDW